MAKNKKRAAKKNKVKRTEQAEEKAAKKIAKAEKRAAKKAAKAKTSEKRSKKGKKGSKLSKKQRRSLEEQIAVAFMEEREAARIEFGGEELEVEELAFVAEESDEVLDEGVLEDEVLEEGEEELDEGLLEDDDAEVDDVEELEVDWSADDEFEDEDEDGLDELLREIMFAEVGRDLFISGAITSHGGNLSLTDGEHIWITRTGVQLGQLGPDDVIETTWDPSDDDQECSSELVVHRALFHALRERCERAGESFGTRAIVHAHTPYTTLQSLDHDEIEPFDSECRYLIPNPVRVVRPARTIGSSEAADMLAELVLEGDDIGIIGGHGPFALGTSLPSAHQLISSLEHSCFLSTMSELRKGCGTDGRLLEAVLETKALAGSTQGMLGEIRKSAIAARNASLAARDAAGTATDTTIATSEAMMNVLDELSSRLTGGAK